MPRARRGRWPCSCCLSCSCCPPRRCRHGPGDGARGEWGQRAPLPEANSEIAVAALDGQDLRHRGLPLQPGGDQRGAGLRLGARRWSMGPPLPAPLHHTVAAGRGRGAVRDRGRVRALGGGPAGRLPGHGLGLRPAPGQRHHVRGLDAPGARCPPPARGWPAAWSTARSTSPGGAPRGGSDFAVYDPAADAWTALPDLPTQRNHLAVEAIGGKVYVAGGRFGGGVGSEMTAAFEVYDPATNAWTAPAPAAGARGPGSTAPSPGLPLRLRRRGERRRPAGRLRRRGRLRPRWPGPGAPWPRSR